MNLSDLVIPPWVKPAACAVALLGSFWGGWTVNGWRLHAHETKALREQQKQFQAQVAKQGKEASSYEQDRESNRVEATNRETQIRTIYKDRPAPADCAAPDSVRSVLDDGIAAANARARGQSGAGVPATATPARAAR